MSKLCPCTMGNSIAGALFNLRNAKKLGQAEQERTASATVRSRRVDTVYSLTKSNSSWAYFVKFHLASGEEVELVTSEEAYKALKENLTGELRWQGEQLVSFT